MDQGAFHRVVFSSDLISKKSPRRGRSTQCMCVLCCAVGRTSSGSAQRRSGSSACTIAARGMRMLRSPAHHIRSIQHLITQHAQQAPGWMYVPARVCMHACMGAWPEHTSQAGGKCLHSAPGSSLSGGCALDRIRNCHLHPKPRQRRKRRGCVDDAHLRSAPGGA